MRRSKAHLHLPACVWLTVLCKGTTEDPFLSRSLRLVESVVKIVEETEIPEVDHEEPALNAMAHCRSPLESFCRNAAT